MFRVTLRTVALLLAVPGLLLGGTAFASTATVGQYITITETSPPLMYPGSTATITATSNVGLPVTLHVDTPATCSLSGSTLTATAVGQCWVEIMQSGTSTYVSTDSLSGFNITAGTPLPTQTLQITPPTLMKAGTSVPLTVTSSSGMPVNITVAPSDTCTFANGMLNAIGDGVCQIDASVPGNGSYATTLYFTSFQVVDPNVFIPTVTLNLPATMVVDATTNIVASANSGLPIYVFTFTPDTCTVSQSETELTAIAPGICTVQATVMGAAGIESGFTRASVQITDPNASPQTGYWWNPAESGRGFVLEVQGTTLFMAGFLYSSTGEATWVASTGPMTTLQQYSGSLITYTGGQTLTGAYQAPALAPSLGNLSMSFTDASHGTLTWPGGTIPIERFDFGPGGAAATQPATNAQTGWWWNPNESGRGFAIEIQGSAMYFAGYMYDANGNPTWYLANGAMTASTLFQGNWQQYGGGETLTGSYHAPSVTNTNAGNVTLQIFDTTDAKLTLPDGSQIQLVRFQF